MGAFPFCPFRVKASLGVPGLEPCKPGLELPPRIEDTDECAQRACLRMAEVTVIHSVVIRATGSTATETAVLFEGIPAVPFRGVRSKLDLLISFVKEGMSASGKEFEGAPRGVVTP